MISFDDTIIAPATIPGTGAIAIVRISGKNAFELADCLAEFRSGNAESARPNSVKFALVKDDDGSVVDEVLCCIYHRPHSYTGEDSVEIMCHSSVYIVNFIIQKALAGGARMANPGEFTHRAFLAGKMDLTQAEAVADVIASTTRASHRVAMNQLKGGFSQKLKELRLKLLKMTSLMELELDFSEEDVEFANRDELTSLVDETLEHIDKLTSSFKLGNAIKNGVPVAIVGDTNAGKSTLLNALLGEQRAIVSDIAGTTRDTIEECLNIDGILFRFIDTAGIRADAGEIEKIGIERSFISLGKADIVLVVVDAAEYVSQSTLDKIFSSINSTEQKTVVLLNKADKVDDDRLEEVSRKIKALLRSKSVDSAEIIYISAKNEQGISALRSLLSNYEKNNLSAIDSDTVLVTNARHLSALQTAARGLQTVRTGLTSSLPTDLVAEDLRSTLSVLGSITGEISTDEVLGEIFGKFCIGK